MSDLDDDDDHDAWTYPEPQTEDQAARRRESAVRALEGDEPLPVGNVLLLVLKGPPRESPARFTCDGCDRRLICRLAYDPYNTDGDCLWLK
jgi:hypothetical protein